MQSFIDEVADVPLFFSGEAWFYSVGMDIQGYIIEKLSGQSFGESTDAAFRPPGMVDTAFYVPDAKYDRLSEVYGLILSQVLWCPGRFPT